MTENRNRVKSVYVNSKSNRIYYEFFDNEGKLKQKSTKKPHSDSNMQTAKDAIPAFEARLEELATQADEKPFSYYADLYISHNQGLTKIKVYRSRLDKMIEFFGGNKILPREITRLMIKNFFAALNNERDTKSDWLVPLRGALENAVDDGAIPGNVAKDFSLPKQKRLRPKNERIKPFTSEEVDALIAVAKGDLRNYIGIGVYTGMRPEEIIGLMVADIDFDSKNISIDRAITKTELKTTKTAGSHRTIPLFSPVKEFFSNQIAVAKTKKSLFLFSKKNGERLDDIEDIRGQKGLSRNRRNDGAWYRLRSEAGLGNIDLRNTRHTFAVRAIESGQLTLQEIASILGHTSLKPLFENYAKWMDNNLDKIDRDFDPFSRLSTGKTTGSQIYLDSQSY